MIREIRNLISKYDMLLPVMQKSSMTIDPKGNLKEEVELVRASKYFDVRDETGKLDDDKAETLMEEASVKMMWMLHIKTKGALEYIHKEGKIRPQDYERLKQSGENLKKHQEIYEWCIDALLTMNIISDAKIIDHQIIMNYEGEIEAVKKRPEGFEETKVDYTEDDEDVI